MADHLAAKTNQQRIYLLSGLPMAAAAGNPSKESTAAVNMAALKPEVKAAGEEALPLT